MSTAFHQQVRNTPAPISIHDAKLRYASMPESYKRWVDELTFVDFFTGTSRASFYFHDYESGGTDPAVDIPLQHAGVRVDLQLRVLDEPNDWFCKPSGDRLPHPAALILTKISLRHVQKVGLSEPVFFRNIRQEMALPMTCNTGYNSIKYDDEMTRFGFYRNLIPAYEHEYSNGNSRWDILQLTAAVAAWDPKNYLWPLHPDTGKNTLKLEYLVTANGLTQKNAHNAVDDVLATVQWARCLREKSPAMFNYFYERRTKAGISKDLTVGALGVIASPMYREQGYAVPVFVIGQPFGNDKNKFICLDLSDMNKVRYLWKLAKQGVDAVFSQLYVKNDDASPDHVRLPIIQTAINKCPMFIPSTHTVGKRVDWSIYAEFLSALTTPDGLEFKRAIISACSSDFEHQGDADDVALYSGFPSKKDQINLQTLISEPISQAFSVAPIWDSERYARLWSLARCKYLTADGLLNDDELSNLWECHRKARLDAPLVRNEKHKVVTPLTLIDALKELDALYLLDDYQAYWPEIKV